MTPGTDEHLLLVLSGHTDWVWGVAWSPDGSRVATGGADATVGVWDPVSGDRLLVLSGHTNTVRGVAWSPDWSRLATGGADRTVRVWDPVTGDRLLVLSGHTDRVRGVAWSPDGSRIATGSDDATVGVWDPVSGERLLTLSGHTGEVNGVAWSPDGSRVATGSADATVGVWDPVSGERLLTLSGHTNTVRGVAWSPDGSRVATGGADRTVGVWDPVTGDRLLVLSGHTGWVRGVAWSPDGSRIATGSDDRTVGVWDPVTGDRLLTLSGHTGGVLGVAWSPDGSRLATASYDETGRVWDLRPIVDAPPNAALASDLESRTDALGFAGDVGAIAQVLTERQVTPPLSIALLGDWGTGKSSFMRQLQHRVTELATTSSAAPDSVYVTHIRQVRFNAWHYSDDHLWVGLIEHLFRGLRDDPANQRSPTRDNSMITVRLEAELGGLEAERVRLARDLATIDERDRPGALAGPWAVLRAIHTIRRAGRVGVRQALRAGWQLWLAIVVWLLAAAAIAVALTGVVQDTAVWTSVAAVTAAIAEVWRRTRQTDKQIDQLGKSGRQLLVRERERVERRIADTSEQLNKLDPKRRLDQLLADISAPDRYESYRGLVGRIRADLDELSTDLHATQQSWRTTSAGRPNPPPPIERIVLYVDDLDRCAPQRVADVLQAVNLLLGLDLFMVVVAVDPRWLVRALEIHHREIFAATDAEISAAGAAAEMQPIGPLAFLDKIFHVPFALRPMGQAAPAYLAGLLPAAAVEQPAPVPDTPNQQAPTASSTAQSTTASTASSPAAPSPPTAAPQPVPSPTPAVRLREPSALTLRPHERDFVTRLTPLFANPRAVKRLANLYRLLRLSIPSDHLDEWLGEPQHGGPFQAATLLLAASAGTPHQAKELLRLVRAETTTRDIGEVLRHGGEPGALAHRLADLIDAIEKETSVERRPAIYRTWAGYVARFGFDTYDLYVAD